MLNLYPVIPLHSIASLDISVQTVNNLWVIPFNLPESLSLDKAWFHHYVYERISYSRSQSCSIYNTYDMSVVMSIGIYSYTGSTLTLVGSGLRSIYVSTTVSLSSSTATSLSQTHSMGFLAQWQYAQFPSVVTLTKGNWWVAHAFTSSFGHTRLETNSNAGGSSSSATTTIYQSSHALYYPTMQYTSFDSLNFGGPFFKGSYSVTTTALPASIHTSNMVTGESRQGNMYIILGV
jgi:hypothetical protein